MSTKQFCDLCDQPANQQHAFATMHYEKGFDLSAVFSVSSGTYPKIGDVRGDICKACMASGLRQLAGQLEAEKEAR